MKITKEQSFEENRKFLGFIKECPTSYQTVNTLKKIFDEAGFVQKEEWEYGFWNKDDAFGSPDGEYKGYVIRNDSSIIAFRVPACKSPKGFKIVCSHTDSPMFKFKDNGEYGNSDTCLKLDVEKYGGMITQSWFDRPLGAAGRIVCDVDGILDSILVNISEPSFIIPSLAIHMTRGNDASKTGISVQKEMQPVAADKGLYELIRKEFGIKQSDILGTDLYLYNTQEGCIMGENASLISAPRIDDLQCVYSTMTGFIQTRCQDKPERDEYIKVYAAFDNEEVGSGTKQGAASTFLYDVLWRMNKALGKNEEEFYRAVAGSFMLSCDNAHAVHPNYRQKTDVTNCVYMNDGIVIKSHAGQKYTSDAVSVAVFRMICEKAGVPLQYFANRSDEAGGSTLGNIAMTQVSMNTVDIGLPQLAMHSAYETAGVKDTEYMVKAVETFYASHIQADSDGNYQINQ